MIFKINKTLIAYILLYIICLQSLGIALPGNVFIALFMPIIGIFLVWELISDKFFINNLIYMIKYSPFIYFCIFYLWSILTILIAFSKGLFYFSGFITGFIGGLTFSFLLVFITVYILLKKNYINLKGVIKFLAIFYLFVFVIGIIQFIGNEYNIDAIREFVTLFNNKRRIFFDQELLYNLSKNRVQSIFDEPGYFGAYVYTQIPIIFALCLSKYKIFKNKILNFSVKKLLIPLAFINIILTRSPISLIFVFIVTLLYFLKDITKYIKKYYIQIFSILLIISISIIISINTINIEETYIKRIIVTIPNLFSLKTLIIVEPSLATRIINYIIMIQEGIKNISFGIGYGTLTKHFSVLLQNTTLPLTMELVNKMRIGGGSPAAAILYRVFCETGLIGIILLLTFYFRTILKLYRIKLTQKNIEKDFCYGLFISLLAQSTFLLFYESNLHYTYNIILYAITIYLITNNLSSLKMIKQEK